MHRIDFCVCWQYQLLRCRHARLQSHDIDRPNTKLLKILLESLKDIDSLFWIHVFCCVNIVAICRVSLLWQHLQHSTLTLSISAFTTPEIILMQLFWDVERWRARQGDAGGNTQYWTEVWTRASDRVSTFIRSATLTTTRLLRQK